MVSENMDVSFKEKSAAISLVAVLGVYGYYFYFVFLGTGPASPEEMLFSMMALVVVLVIVEVAFHIVVAVLSPREANAAEDERERLIALKAYRVSYLLMSAGALLVLGRILFGSVVELEQVTLLGIANLLLFALVLAEAGRYSAAIYHFRRGV
jgi:hypothetical protein